MIREDMTPSKYKVTFSDAGIRRTQYTDDLRYYEKLVADHGHLSDLSSEAIELTAEQQARLDNIADAGLSAHDASVYVRYGTTESEGTGYHDPSKLKSFYRDCCEPVIKAQRKAAEDRGVIVNGIRYAGGASNRQALSEAVQAAQDSGETVFSRWKDSDGQYHRDHPVTDVEQALRKIGKRRSALINLEADHIDAVVDEEEDPLNLDWSTEYD